MSTVWHLIRHNLRTHGTLLFAWIATVVALPAVASVPWSAQIGAGMGASAAIILQGARLLLGMAAIASIVQADGPTDDRAFWRTRPIASRTLAGAHLLTVGLIFVVVPTLVVFGVAVLFGVPRSYWLATVLQVVTMEMAIAGFSLVVASRTRGLATFIIAAIAGVISFYLLVGAMYELRRFLEWGAQVRMADPLRGLWASLGVGALLLPVLFVVAMAGPRRQRALLAGVLVVLASATGAWFIPALRFVPPPTVDAGLAFTETSIHSEFVPDASGAVAIVLAVRPGNGHPRDEWRFWLKDGTLSTMKGVKVLHGTPGGYAPRGTHPAVSTVIAVLSPAEFKALAGTRVRLEGWLRGDVVRHVTEATATLAQGASLDTDHLRLSVSRVLDGTPDPDRRMRPVLDGTEVYLPSPGRSFRHADVYVMRDRTSGCEVIAYAWPTSSSPVMQFALLPTLLPPFTVRRIQLAERVPPACRVDPSNAEIEMRTNETRSADAVPVAIDFTLPIEPSPAEPRLGLAPLRTR